MTARKFFYIRSMNRNITVTYELTENTQQSVTAMFAYAVQNPHDEFNKKMGRSIAIGRLDKFGGSFARAANFRDLHREICVSIMENADTEQCVQKLIGSYLAR